MCFFLAPPFVVVDFFVTFVDVLAKEDVVFFVLGTVAFGFAGAGVVAGAVAGVAAGFLVASTF